MPDGRLWLARDAYAAGTAWAPRYVGKELRLARLGAFNAALAPPRRRGSRRRPQGRQPRPRRAARDPGRQLPGPARPLPAARTGPHPGHGRPEEWEHATAGSRRLAIAAVAELRRRHPQQNIEPLRSAEPAPASDTEREQPDPAPDGKLTETPTWIRDLAIQRQAFRARPANARG